MNYWTKNIFKRIIRLTPLYLLRRSILNEKSQEKIFAYLNSTLKNAREQVPYYQKKYENLKCQISINNFDYIDKQDIIGIEDLLISNKFNKKTLLKSSTGGTTGLSLNLYRTYKSVILESIFIDNIFKKIGQLKKLRIAVLRGNKPTKGIYEFKNSTLLLSSYDLNIENTITYIKQIETYNINCIHAYPTSILIFCKYINSLGDSIKIPKIKGIITSSETISCQDKETILNTFKEATLIDIYGQNEHVALAYSINLEPYNFIKEYSYVEFLDTGRFLLENRICEIVGTGFINRAMPLIRYKTEDYAEIDSNGKVISIIGRTQDIIVNEDKELLPCIILTRDNTLKNVISFQYFQEKIGELDFRVVVNDSFSNIDKDSIIQDIKDSFNYKVKPRVVICNKIERLPNGKQKRLIQRLDINLYK